MGKSQERTESVIEKGERQLICVEKRWRELKVCSKKGRNLKSIYILLMLKATRGTEKKGEGMESV